MFDDYRGEGFGFYYTRLQAKLVQEEKQRRAYQRSDSGNQVDTLDLGS